MKGGLALLKYKKVFNCRSKNNGETLHSYLSKLRLAYERPYSPPKVDPLPEEASTEQKNEKLKQQGALAFYNKRKNEDILCQFINGLDKDLKEIFIRQDDLLKRPVESVLKQISTLEEEQGVNKKVAATTEMPAENNVRQSDLEGIVKKTVEEKVEEMFKKAAVLKGVGELEARQDLAPNLQIFAMLAKGSQLPFFKWERGWLGATKPPLNSQKGAIMYPYRSPEVHTVHKGNNCKGYHVRVNY